MILKLRKHKILPLNRISPSQFHSAISCPYKLVLANSFGFQPLVPPHANAYFGSIIHKMIELISKGTIYNEQTFSEQWVDLIKAKEDELKDNGLARITPLKYFVTDFAIKKNQVKKILLKKQEKLSLRPKSSSCKYYPEKRLENPDKSISGIADLIIENESGTTILDFKSGKIFSDTINESEMSRQVIKRDYDIQLKLYAHLYFLMTKKYPKSLFIVTLSNDFIELKFNVSECKKIYSEALEFIHTTNSFISNRNLTSIANPSLENCKFCAYRPACDFYIDWLSVNFETVNDLFGIVEKVNQFNNETLGLELRTQGKHILINGFPLGKRNEFEALIGKNITLYNLKKTKQSLYATANSFTVIYEQ